MRRLYAAGRFDLALGRLFEGHVDALQIIIRYAGPETARRVTDLAATGATFGVWNAPLADAPLTVDDGRLRGGKSFASGAGVLSHALVSANAGDAERVQLVLVDLNAAPPAIDTRWWQTLGMQYTETHQVRWPAAPDHGFDLIGEPGDYQREPWFSQGALRFVAVQAGGIAAVFDHVRDHLVARSRAEDPHQATRLARLYDCAEASAAIVERAAIRLFEDTPRAGAARVSHARAAVAERADLAIALAQQSVGLQGLFLTHPLSRALADLMVYLRQPGPDAQLTRTAAAAAAGDLVPDL